jgi:hypothetical protein
MEIAQDCVSGHSGFTFGNTKLLLQEIYKLKAKSIAASHPVTDTSC